MNDPKVRPEDYVQFLLASPLQFTCAEAARVHPAQPDPPDQPAHDAFNRLLTGRDPDPEALWAEALPQIRPAGGVLVLDDSTLDKPYARKMDLVGWHWSGKHHAVVKGINLLTLLWTDGDRHVPLDYRLYDKPNDHFSKNDLFGHLLQAAAGRGLRPECVCFDGWYGGLENLKLLRTLGWTWLTRLKSNRKVRVDFGPPRAVSEADIGEGGREVHLPGYGQIQVFRVAATNGGAEHWATSDLKMDELTRLKYAEFSWRIEEYHRGIKQFCGVEGCQARRGRAQRNHIGLSLRAFLRMESHCFTLGISWFQAKMDVIRSAVRAYLEKPVMRLPQAA